MAEEYTKLKEGQIDQTNILHKDASNEEKLGALNSRKGFGVGDGNLAGDGFSYLPGYVGGKPVVGSFFGLTSTFGNHGSVTGNAAVYLTMSDADRGWIFQVNSGGVVTNVASIDGEGRATFQKAVELYHAAALGQIVSNTNTSVAILTLTTPSRTNYYQHTGTGATWTLPDATTNVMNRIVCTHKGSGLLKINAFSANQIWESGTPSSDYSASIGESVNLYSDGVHWIVL